MGRNPQRALGPLCDPTALRLGAIEPLADVWWEVDTVPAFETDDLALPPAERVRAYLLDGLESTLALLEKTPETDQDLYFYRLALFHEDACGEAMVQAAQAFGVPLKLPMSTGMAAREPLRMPATRWTLGIAPDAAAGALLVPAGFTFDNETMAHEVQVPEFEIDAQPVSWAQFVEFVDDGGYDDATHWRPDGWAWLQQAVLEEGRRAPRHARADRRGQPRGDADPFWQSHAPGWPPACGARQLVGEPMPGAAGPAAGCRPRWSGRPRPTPHPAVAGAGGRFGNGRPATCSPTRVSAPARGIGYSAPWFGRARVLRGASFATRQRMKHPRFRGFALPDDDTRFVGFRSCAV